MFRFAVSHWEGYGVVGRGEGFFGDEGGIGVAGGVIGDRGDGGDEQDTRVLGACDAPVDKVADATNVIFEGLERSSMEQSIISLSISSFGRETYSTLKMKEDFAPGRCFAMYDDEQRNPGRLTD